VQYRIVPFIGASLSWIQGKRGERGSRRVGKPPTTPPAPYCKIGIRDAATSDWVLLKVSIRIGGIDVHLIWRLIDFHGSRGRTQQPSRDEVTLARWGAGHPYRKWYCTYEYWQSWPAVPDLGNNDMLF